MPGESLEGVKSLIAQYEHKYRQSARNWKLGYRFLLVASAFLSATAAIIGKFNVLTFPAAGDVSSILAALAAVLMTIIAALDFEVNWRINRRSRHEVDVIAREAEKSTADPDKLISALQDVIKRRNEDLNKQD